MKSLLLPLSCFIVLATFAQPATSFEYTPSFSAIVVKNMETSSKWYQSVFNLKVKDQVKDDNAGYNIVILESPSLTLELLQLKNSFNPKEGKSGNVEPFGLLKIGFKTKDMDACLKQLASLNITVPQIWTDSETKKRNFLITDPDGNLIQFFE